MSIATGASPDAIRFHYDIANEFYEAWLDPELIYSCALFEENEGIEALDRAQIRKLDFLANWAHVAADQRVLDIGCGWGGMLRRLTSHFGVRSATGISLSKEQTAWIRKTPDPRIEVRIESWMDHEPLAPYDAIVSVEAMEAFVRPGLSVQERTDAYREFFARCHEWLRPGGMLVLQSTAYGNSGPEDLNPFISNSIFPETDLPRLIELAPAHDRLFEIRTLVNHREHFVTTLRAWLARLQARRADLINMKGKEAVDRYERYLNLSTYMFASGSCDLYRLAYRRIDYPRIAGKQLGSKGLSRIRKAGSGQ